MLAAAKINLDLRITGLRDDGYHFLDSLVVFADVGDELVAEPCDNLSLEITGPFADGLSITNNIIIDAAKLVCEKAGIKPNLKFKLTKNLPVASGIGGGSADAAATIKLCIELLDIHFTGEKLNQLALKIGADVPVCMLSKACRMQGIGEIITPVNLESNIYMLLVNPGISVSTPEIFRCFHETNSPFDAKREQFIDEIHLPLMMDQLKSSKNSLEKPAYTLNKEIKEVLLALQATDGVLLSRMSGSGATCFAIYGEEEKCALAATELKKKYNNWWIRETRLLQ